MNAAHTPGPWIIDHAPNIPGVPLYGGQTSERHVTEIRSGYQNARERPGVVIGSIASAADARLIAAAPDLLAALEWSLNAMEARTPHVAEGERFIAARALIRAATGN